MNAPQLTDLCESIIKAERSIKELKAALGVHQEVRNRAENAIVAAMKHPCNEVAISLSDGLYRLVWERGRVSLTPMTLITGDLHD